MLIKWPWFASGHAYRKLAHECKEIKDVNRSLLALCAGLRNELDRRTDSLKDLSREVALLRDSLGGPVARQRRAAAPPAEPHPHRRRSDEPDHTPHSKFEDSGSGHLD